MLRSSTKILLFIPLLLVVGLVAWSYMRGRQNDSEIIREADAMMGAEPAPIAFAKRDMSCSERKAFLTVDYRIVRRVRDLPDAIQKLFTMMDGSRSAIADPGEAYEVGDYIEDIHKPRRRLRFAGVAKDRAFIYYDHGGYAHTFETDFFRIGSAEEVEGIWHGSTREVKISNLCGTACRPVNSS